MTIMMRCGLLLAPILFTWLLAAVPPAKADHGMSGDTAAAREQLSASVHRNESCMSCHGEHGGPEAARESCQGCHWQEGTDFWRGSHGATQNREDKEAPTCVSCHGSHSVRPARDRAAATSPGLAPAACGSCHKQAADEFAASVHGRALVNKESANAPSCATCHGAHTALPVRREQVAETCGSCHIEAQVVFRRSVHGTAVVRGVLHAPTCTGCHGVHTVRSVTDPSSPTAALRVAGETCARCHGSVRITEMHNLPIEVIGDFRGSFHGLAGAVGDRRVANCASCHGYHEIRPSSSPLSSIHPANLGRTCGQCHPGAAERFAQGGVHHTTKTWGHRLVGWVASMYAGMITLVIGLMMVHNGLDFQRRWRDRRRREAVSTADHAPEYLRFTLNERVQHWVLAGSFFTLTLTGFALRFGWRLPWLDGEIQQTLRAGIHRGTAILFMSLGVYHFGYLVLTARGREMAQAILPRLRNVVDVACCLGACIRIGPPSAPDWRELLATLKYNLGLTKERPTYGRFTYWEKMEYWALVWGTVVMAVTGLVMWIETPFLNRFPYWAFELFRTVHFYEAILAGLSIVVWHLYATVVNPDVFPLNQAMTRGTLTHDEMLREHPLDINSTVKREDDDFGQAEPIARFSKHEHDLGKKEKKQ